MIRAGWRWAGIEGPVELAGHDDHLDGADDETTPLPLPDVFTAAGDTHGDWHEFDRVTAAERRVACSSRPSGPTATADLPGGRVE
ncbi:MAG: hypothetical protein ABR540_20650 [Acidimicrobiales bacterium]